MVSFLALFMSDIDLAEWVWCVQALAMLKRFTSSDFLVLSQLQKRERTGKEYGCLAICLKN